MLGFGEAAIDFVGFSYSTGFYSVPNTVCRLKLCYSVFFSIRIGELENSPVYDLFCFCAER
jgi:hypothetical protein